MTKNCENLREFSISLASTDRLNLYLSSWNVNELPSSLLNVKNLQSFDFSLNECLVDLPENFANYIRLGCPRDREYDREHDPSLTLHKVFPSPAFTSLKHLRLDDDITTLSEIPDNISLLSSLETLTLSNLAITSLPETIKYLPRLYWLYVYSCRMLQSIPTLSLNLVNFTVYGCGSLETVLSSMDEPDDKPNPCTVVLLNCKNLDPHSYRTVLKGAIVGIEVGANEKDDTIQYFLPALPGIEYWFHYRSPQVSFTLELPPNLLGFAYYLVLSQGLVGVDDIRIGCECYLDNISGERIPITSSPSRAIFKLGWDRYPITINMESDQVLWYDPVRCKKIMEEIKAINDANSTSYSPKLTFRFFIDENLYDAVVIQECGFRWIYREEMVSATIFESRDQEETVSPSDLQSNYQEETVPPTEKLDETKDVRCLLEELLHIGFGGDHMKPLLFGEEKKE